MLLQYKTKIHENLFTYKYAQGCSSKKEIASEDKLYRSILTGSYIDATRWCIDTEWMKMDWLSQYDVFQKVLMYFKIAWIVLKRKSIVLLYNCTKRTSLGMQWKSQAKQ